MSRSKQLWISECEKVFQAYADGEITHQDAFERLTGMGLERESVLDELHSIKAIQEEEAREEREANSQFGVGA